MEYPRKSYWHETVENKEFSNKDVKDKKFDLLIIGAGITGLITAYMLRNSGYKIGIIEGSKIGYGTTGYTSAKITVQHDIRYDHMINSFGLNSAKQYLKANEEGLKIIKEIVNSYNINCDFKEQTSYIYTTKDDEVDILKKEYEAYKKLSIDGVFVENDNLNLPIQIKAALGIRNQAQFNPLKFLYRLTNILTESLCEIYENVRAVNIEPNNNEHIVNTNCGKIYAKKVVVASHYPFDIDFGLFFLRIYQEKSYMMAVETPREPFEGMFININDPTYSLRYHFSNDTNLLLLGGANHKVGIKDNEEDSYNELEQFLKDNLKNYKIISKWSTQDCMTYDKVPYVGSISNNVDNIFVATGFNKWGMTQSAASALILRNKILNIDDDYSEIFNPSRVTPVLSAKEFLATGKNIASGFIKRIMPSELDDIFDVEKDEGKIVNYKGRKVGVYRNKIGDYFCINPVCTHMKCALSFNNAEKTWDCQCHGSRFDAKGNILEGPAVYPLDKIKIKKE